MSYLKLLFFILIGSQISLTVWSAYSGALGIFSGIALLISIGFIIAVMAMTRFAWLLLNKNEDNIHHKVGGIIHTILAISLSVFHLFILVDLLI
jgi:hypothetical protein